MRTDYLLTGDTGFLGKILSRTLRQKSGANQSIYGLSEIFPSSKPDISRPFNFNRELSAGIVIHCAGKAHIVPRTTEEAKAFFDVNYEGTKNLCNALSTLNILPKAFILISTVAVYGIDEGEHISEQHPLNGNTPYAQSKILAEDWVQSWGISNKVTTGILRLPLIAGAAPPGNLGAMIKGIRSGKYLSIGHAKARKSIVWAEDIAGIFPRLSETGGVYHLTDGYHPGFGELENRIAQALSQKQPRKIPEFVAGILGLAGDIIGSRFPINSDKVRKIMSTLTFDDSKARELLGWESSNVLDKIREII